MDLHMREFNGTTFGMESQSAPALRALKKAAFYGEVIPRGWHRPVKRLCVPAQKVAAVMGEAAWLITENRCMETVRWGDSAEHYIIYDDQQKSAMPGSPDDDGTKTVDIRKRGNTYTVTDAEEVTRA